MDLFDISEGFRSLGEGLSRVQCPAMVIGVQTDILFPIWQQRQLAKVLQETGKHGISRTYIHDILYICQILIFTL